MKYLQNPTSRCALAVLSGLIYASTFPPIGWRWLILPGLTGFLISLHGKAGTPICFDAASQNIIRKMTLNGGVFIVIPTMDAES